LLGIVDKPLQPLMPSKAEEHVYFAFHH